MKSWEIEHGGARDEIISDLASNHKYQPTPTPAAVRPSDACFTLEGDFMAASQRVSRGFHRLALFLAAIPLVSAVAITNYVCSPSVGSLLASRSALIKALTSRMIFAANTANSVQKRMGSLITSPYVRVWLISS
jgi:hypothetical protein